MGVYNQTWENRKAAEAKAKADKPSPKKAPAKKGKK